MPPDTTAFWEILLNPGQWTLVNVIAVLAGIATLIGIFVTIWSKWSQWRHKWILERRFGSEFFTPDTIKFSTKYYIPPYYSDDDPTNYDIDIVDFDKISSGELYVKVDEFLSDQSNHHHMMLLGDSGTGKTSFLLNYYARNQLQRKKKRQRIALIPLGIPNAIKLIEAIKEPQNTFIFLDGFDEDNEAVKDHQKQLKLILESCVLFRRVLITCRTQFIPEDKALNRETSLPVLDPRSAGSPGTYDFLVLYLSPFSDDQVKTYLRKRYRFWHRNLRKKAFELVKKIPSLAIRPMLLSHIPDILKSNKTFNYTFQLYEEMVDAWLKRERLSVAEKESLRRFSEELAVELYANKEKRKAERIHKDELAPLAKQKWNINLEEWKFRSRSLLNRDLSGNYKFAHRSIMEYLFVKRFWQRDKACQGVRLTDQMQTFLKEMIRHYREIGKSLPFEFTKEILDLLGIKALRLRVTPKENLSGDTVKIMLKEYDFYCKNFLKITTWHNSQGKGIEHFYQFREINGDKIIVDHATGLTWQQGGTPEEIKYNKAKEYIDKLNRDKFAGFNNWRLPTLEEAMSLMEREKRGAGLYIDPVFDQEQRWIWTADKRSASVAWVVFFRSGFCDYNDFGFTYTYVRGVRSGQSSR